MKAIKAANSACGTSSATLEFIGALSGCGAVAVFAEDSVGVAGLLEVTFSQQRRRASVDIALKSVISAVA